MPTPVLSVSGVAPKVMHTGESLLVGFDFTPLLRKDPTTRAVAETLTGTPTVTDASGVLTIGTPAVNAAAYLGDEGQTVAIGCAVQVRISGAGVSGTDYTLTVSCGTTDSNTRKETFSLQYRDS